MYLINDFAFRHGHITPDGRFFSHVHYDKDKDAKHSHSEEELILLDVLSNPTFLDVELPEFIANAFTKFPFVETLLICQSWISNYIISSYLLRGPPLTVS